MHRPLPDRQEVEDMSGAGRQVVLFGSGSPIIVEIEESCARAGWQIAYIVKNVEGRDFARAAGLVRSAAETPAIAEDVLVPLFSPANRERAVREARGLGAKRFPALVDRTCILARDLQIEEGAYVNAGCTIGASVRIGQFAFVNRTASLGHHLSLGEFASIGPGVVVCGQVTIGARAMIGAGAILTPGITIGAGAVVSAGTVVRRDVPEGTSTASGPGVAATSGRPTDRA